MRNKDRWAPSKFVFKKGKLVASRNLREVAGSSRLMTDIIASHYDSHIPRYVSGKLIDLGCGRVPLYEAYKRHVDDNICVDWKNTFHRNEFVDYECNLAEHLPFGEEEFDTIILSDVLEHIERPEQLWQEMARILRPGGKILMNVPFFYWLHEEPYDYYRYTSFVLKRFAENAGFEIIHLEATGGTPEILADILAKHIQIIPLVGTGLAISIQFVASFLIKIMGKKLSNKTATKYPFGYFMVAEKRLKCR